MKAAHGEPADFFISYTGRDVEWARWVAAQLEKAGYQVIIQDWDWGPGANFVAEMHRALSVGARVLPIATRAYLDSRWTEEEWTAAFYQGRSQVIPVCVEPLTLPGLLGPLARIDLHGLQEEEARAALLRGVGGPSGRDLNAPYPDNPAPPFPITRWSSVRSRNGEFIGRDEDLQSITNAFEGNSVIVLTGPPGIGKSEIALEFFYRHAADYDFACYADGSDIALLNIDLANAAAEYGLPAPREGSPLEIARWLLSWLSTQSKWLVILDDVRDAAACSDLVSLQCGNVLITTMNEGWPLAGRVIPISAWARATTIRYLEQKLGPSASVGSLAEVLMDIPLAATQARSYISSTGMSIEEYEGLLQERVRALMDRGETGPHSTTLTAAIDLNVSRLGQHARDLAEICATLAPEAIPIEIFRATPSWPELFPEAFSEELILEDAIAELRRQSLVKRDGPFLFMHQLLQRIILESLDNDSRVTAILRASAILAAATPQWTDRPENWPRCEKLLPHVLEISDSLEQTLPELAAFLLNRMGTYVGAIGNGQLAVDLLEEGLHFAETADERDTAASILNNLGNAVAGLGDLDRGIELLSRALEIKRKSKQTTPMLLSRTVGALGSLLRRKGDFSTALALHREALTLLEADDEPDPHLIADESNDVGVCAAELGLYEEALRMHQRALNLALATEGPDGQTVGSSHFGLANLYEATGQEDVALTHLDEGLRILSKGVGIDHPDFARGLSQKGLLLINAGQPGDARVVLEQAVATAEAAFGASHPDVGMKLGNLGIALHELGQFDDAIEVHQRSLDLLRKGLRGQDRSVAIQLANLGASYRGKGDLNKASMLFAEALEVVPIPPVDTLVVRTVEVFVALSKERGVVEQAQPILQRLEAVLDFLEGGVRRDAFEWLGSLWVEVGDLARAEKTLKLAAPTGWPRIKRWLRHMREGRESRSRHKKHIRRRTMVGTDDQERESMGAGGP